MAILRLVRSGEATDEGAGTWGDLVAWFSQMVTCLDRGDIAGAAEAQVQIERFGFRITYRRNTLNIKEVVR